MKRTIETKFYEFDQNNSGGSFHVDKHDGIAHSIIIEDVNENSAYNKLQEITQSYNDFCECCGERWSDYTNGGKDEPCVYNEPVQEGLNKTLSYYRTTAAVHFYDGTTKWYEKEKNND